MAQETRRGFVGIALKALLGSYAIPALAWGRKKGAGAEDELAVQLEKLAGEIAPGPVYRVINLEALSHKYENDPVSLMEEVEKRLKKLNLTAQNADDSLMNVDRALRHNDSSYVDTLRDKSGRLVKLMVLQALPKENFLLDAASNFSGLSPETCKKLGWDKKYDFTQATWESRAINHEFGHFIGINTAREDLKNLPIPKYLEISHAREMFADVFSVLMALKSGAPDSMKACEALATWRYMQPLNVLPEEAQDATPPLLLPVYYITSRGVLAAINEYKRRIGTKDALEHMSVKEIAGLAQQIAGHYCFTSTELKEMSDDLLRARAKLELHTQHMLDNEALKKPLDSETLQKWSAMQQLNAFISAYQEEERMKRIMDLHLLDDKKPWVQEMAQAWKEAIAPPLPPASPADTHVKRFSRRDVLGTLRGNRLG